MKNNLIFVICLLVLILAILLPIQSSATNFVNTSYNWSKIRISVFDEQNQPIDMATVCIVETNEYFQTAKLGQIELCLELPAKNNIFKKNNWQEYTILIYKNGYKPHILYGLKAIPDITRTGIVVILKDNLNSKDIPFTESYDYPSHDYSSTIIDKYKK